MKKLLTSIVLLTTVCLYPLASNAQLLKNIMNSVKMPGKKSQKPDTTHTKTTNTSSDSASSAAVMKYLGKIGQANAVSPADSAAAIATFKKSGGGGSGIHYQYLITAIGKQKTPIKDTMNVYFTNSGQGRSEMNLAGMIAAAAGVKTGGSPLVAISNIAKRNYSVFLDADSKSYSLNIIDTSLINSGRDSYQVTKIGNETIDGYNCTHAKLTSNYGKGITKHSTTMDIWTSADVPGYTMLKNWMSTQNVTPKMMQALDQAGCGGFMVKMSNQTKDLNYSMDLVKAEKNSFPGSMFSIPPGYTESKYNLMMMNMMQAAQKK
jgi:hypothetical protein